MGQNLHYVHIEATALGATIGLVAPIEDFAARVASGVVTGLLIAALTWLATWLRARLTRKDRP